MADGYLLDTGFLVALVDRRDGDHQRCVEEWKSVRGPLVSVEGVLAETAHLLRHNPGGPRHAVELALSAGTAFSSPTPKRLMRALALMDKYADVPVDWVDALLVVTAEETGVNRVLTLDTRGFLVYRIQGRRSFELMPRARHQH